MHCVSTSRSGQISVWTVGEAPPCAMLASENIPSLHHQVKTTLREQSIQFPCLTSVVRRSCSTHPNRSPLVSHSQHHDEREEGGCLLDCDHVLVHLCTPWIGYGRESIAAIKLTHFDQGNEQSCTDGGKKNGQNPSSRDWTLRQSETA